MIADKEKYLKSNLPDSKPIPEGIVGEDEEIGKAQDIYVLCAGIAHDLNNVLSTISGYSEILQEESDATPQFLEIVSKIQGAVLKGQKITDQLLSLNGKPALKEMEASVYEVLNDTIGFLKPAIPENIIVRSLIPKTDAIVSADPTQLFRVFLNLINNAVQSMESNGGTLSVNLEIVDGNLLKEKLNTGIPFDEYALITFSDTGHGIPASVKGRIFEPYFTTKEEGKGTGLGLQVVKNIVSEMRGEILISGAEGEGSVFYVYLPVENNYKKINS